MQTIAIIVGISSCQDDSFECIPGASADAERFASALMGWGLSKEFIFLLTNEKATKASIVKAFYESQPHFDADAKLIFYFAGHGIRTTHLDETMQESFLICHDTGLRLVELMQLVHMIKPAQAFLFIDACSLRLNQIQNPLNEKEIFSTSNSKGFFCMFSSGLHASYEDRQMPHGYFTSALLKALGEHRQDKQPNCHDLVRKVSHFLNKQNLPIPEVYHIGQENIWPLQNIDEVGVARKIKESDGLVTRWKAIGELQDHLVLSPDAIIWMWGEGGMGKTVIAEQICKISSSHVYTSIPSASTDLNVSMRMLIDQIRNQKGELFFNRPLEATLYQVLDYIAKEQPGTIFILDHLDRLSSSDLEIMMEEVDRIMLPCILISRYPCQGQLFKRRGVKVTEWLALPLNLDEIEELAEKISLNTDASFFAMLQSASKGNPLRVRQMIVKLIDQGMAGNEKLMDDYVNCIQAIASCGSFLDEHLFCKVFHLKSVVLAKLEQLGLIRYTSGGCFPHDLLIEMAEENNWPVDLQRACVYWKCQVKQTPHNRFACRSLVLLASQIENCTFLKNALSQCLKTLNQRENISFLMDLVKISQKHEWDYLLLEASDYLIDHEEYLLAGDVIQPLLFSPQPMIRNHASKNNARRLVWLGRFGEAVGSNFEIFKKCRCPQVKIPLKNNIGIAHFFSGNFDIALKLFHEVTGFKGKKDEREVGVANLMIGLIITYRGENIAKAKELLESSLQVFETTKYYLWNIVSLNSLGDLCYRQRQWRQALYYLNRGVEIAEVLQNKTFLLFTLKNIARVHLRLFGVNSQEVSLSLENLEMVLEEVLKTGHNWVTVWALNVLGTLYAHRHQADRLQKIMDTVTPLTEGYKECHIFTLSNLGHLAGLKKDTQSSKEYYEKAFQLSEEVNNPFALNEIQADFAAIYSTKSKKVKIGQRLIA